NSLDRLIETAISQQLPLYFPVNDPTQQIDKNGVLCIPPDLLPDPSTYNGCSPDKYDIVGFTQMKITNLYRGNTPEAYTYCISRIPGASPSPNARCMITQWVGWQTQGLDEGGGQNFGVVPIRLSA